jgi:NurA-like 5'-3' nuclease
MTKNDGLICTNKNFFVILSANLESMFKSFVVKLNIMLGIMAALLSGCHSKRVTCKYGAPPRKFEKQEAELQKQKDEEELLRLEQLRIQDSIRAAEEAPVPDIPVCKYGPPGGN